MKKHLLLLAMSLLPLVASADAVEIDGIYYLLSGTEASVTSNPNKYSGDISIPSSFLYDYCEYTVTSIGYRAFDACSDLTSISIPNSVVSIGGFAFYECSSLTSIEIPSSVTSIGNRAFSYCLSLTSVNIPSKIQNVDVWIFEACISLKQITVEAGNKVYDSRDNCNAIIETKTNTLVKGCMNTTIPSSVTSIGESAFDHCYMNTIVIPSSVSSIGNQAFANCADLTSIIIPGSVTSIGYGLFDNCGKLISIIVEEGNTVYDSRNSCNGIIETNSNTLKAGCKSTIIPHGVTNISYAFWGCRTLTSIEIPNSVTSIDKSAFYMCTNLTSIKIPNSVTTIGDCAFMECTSLSSIEIPSSVTSIGIHAFYMCYDLTSIKIPSSVTSIGWEAFRNCTSLTSVTMEHSTPLTIDNYFFTNRANSMLYVPVGSKVAYEAADYWKQFKEIIEYVPHAAFTMNSGGIATYSYNRDLDFTSVESLKAYIASGYSPSTGELMMMRVNKVPAGEGLLLKGAAGDYEIPYTDTDMYYSNLLVGVPTATTVNPTDGSYTNFILANDAVKGIGFYPLASAGEIGPNKAYLQLPTSILPAAARSLRMVFEDEEEDVTGINALNEKGALSNEKFFDLQGRRVMKPTRGLYIKDGKKIMVK